MEDFSPSMVDFSLQADQLDQVWHMARDLWQVLYEKYHPNYVIIHVKG